MRTIRKSWPQGIRVKFDPTPASLALYSFAPPPGTEGSVVSVPIGSRRVTYLPGPGGGLVYVEWDNLGVAGVSPIDLETIKKKSKANPRPLADSNPVLTDAERAALPASAFADPKNRRFPIHDMVHARAAIGKLNMWFERGHISRDEYKQYYQRMMKAYSRLGMTSRTPPLVPMPRVIAGKKKPARVSERRKSVAANPTPMAQAILTSLPMRSSKDAHVAILVLNNQYLKGKITDEDYKDVYGVIAAAFKKFGRKDVPFNELEMKAPNANPAKRRPPAIRPYSVEWRKRRASSIAQPNPAGPAQRNDPSGMRSIMMRTLAKPNPVNEQGDPKLAVRMAVPEIGMEADSIGKNISSIDPMEYFDTFSSQMGDPDAAMAALEDMASWGVTDEI